MLRNRVDDTESQRHHESEANRQELTGQKKLYERELEKIRQSQSGEKVNSLQYLKKNFKSYNKYQTHGQLS